MGRWRAILLSCAAFCIPALAGSAMTTPASAGPPRSGVTLTLLWRNDPHEIPALRRVIAAFHTQLPAVSVHLRVVTWNDYEPTLSAMVAAHTPPDLFASLGASGFVDYALRGLGLNQQPFIAADHYDLSDFYPTAIKALRWKGQQLALPLGGGPSLLYANTDLLARAGLSAPPTDWDDPTWTWDRMVSYARKLTVDSAGHTADDPRFAWRHTVQWGIDPGLWPQNAYAWLWGCDWFPTTEGLPRAATINTPCVVASLQRAADLTVKYHVAPDQAQRQSLKRFINPFVSGKIALSMTGPWLLETNAAHIRTFHWALAALPSGTQRKDVLFTDALMISQGSHYPQDAWRFVTFLLSARGQKLFIPGYCCVSLRLSLISTIAAKAPTSQSTASVEQAVSGAFTHGQESSNHAIAQWAALQNLFDIDTAPLWTGQRTAAQVAPALQADMNTLLVQDTRRFGPGR